MAGTSSGMPELEGDIKEQNKAFITEVGPWGGHTGQFRGIKVDSVCLNSITIRSGETIQAIAFSYSDKYRRPHHAGPWGALGGRLAGCYHTILFGPSEYLIKISGTVGMSTLYSCDVVTSLTFTTNISVYGPFGEGRGIPFHSELTSNASIVGFFARTTMGLVDAIGIYVKHVTEQAEKQALITKIGPWGGVGGQALDVDVLPRYLVSVVVRSNDGIDSIAFTYRDCNGQQHSAGPWGAYGGSPSRDGTIHTIVLGRSEILIRISGTVGPTSWFPDVVTSLLFVTNTGSYGPFGRGGGIPFTSPELKNGSIVGFFVRAGCHVDSIGVYIDPIKEKDNGGTSSVNPNTEGHIKELNKPCITKIGMWGGDKGTHCDVDVSPFCLNNITICSGEVVHSLAFSYSDDHGKQHHAGPWGVSDGSFDMIQLGPSEFLTQVSGTVGSFSQYHHEVDALTSVMFTTNARCYGPFGRGGGVPFHTPAMSPGSIIGFFAHAGKGAIDAIGIYVNPGEPMEKRGLITKVGPWGNHLARSYDLDVLPQRLISVVVCSGQVIDSLTFTYIDCNGKQHGVGPWGGLGAPQDRSFHTILLDRSEFLKEISGTIKPNPHSSDVVTSLFFVTNTGSHGPFGEGGGTSFCTTVEDNTSIVGFFAGAGKSINSIGAYLKTTNGKDNGGAACSTSELKGDVKELDEASIMKIGPWGGHKGNPKDIEEAPLCLNSITVRSGELVYSLAFSYSDDHGKLRHAGPWGTCQGFSYGSFDTIQLSPSEFLTEVSGTIDFSTRYSDNVVTSVIFITNACRYGPFGARGRTPFHSPLLSKGSIVGFFSHVGKAFNAIGLYVTSERQPMREAGLVKVGPWGGDSGLSNDAAVLPQRLLSMVVHSGKVINSLSFTYNDCDGQVRTAGPWGGTGEPQDGSSDTILLGDSEILMQISGTVGQSADHLDVVTSLLFVTNAGSYGPYGKEEGNRFQSPRQRDGSIVGFFANAGDVIDAIGVYFSPHGETIEEEEEGGSGIPHGMASRERAIKYAPSILETIILDESAEPQNLPLALLQHITENFADKQEIGRGEFGVVYKGDIQNGSVAVKRLFNRHTIEEKTFNHEASSLIGVNHKNIVRFLGYCANTEGKATANPESGGASRYIFAEIRERLLCFEYISNGSLEKHLTDELRGLEWPTRYQIIRGICDGLVYLHKEKGIVHRDMKPANILLDDLMIPKITDFGISKLLDGATYVITNNPIGTRGYCAPESIIRGVVSMKSDIYSLGVIMAELMTGCKDNLDIKHVLRRWRYRWNKSENYPPFGIEQVTKCIEIAIRCLQENHRKRPDISDIVSMLNDIESTNLHIKSTGDSPVGPISPYSWELLEFDTLELNFAFEINKEIPCSLQLTNVTDNYVAFAIKMTGVLQYIIEPEKGVVPPRSKCSVMVTLQAQKREPHATLLKDELFSMRCTTVNEGFTVENITREVFKNKTGKVIDKVKLKVAI